MKGKRYKLTQQISDGIMAAIRRGGFPHVAAEAFGIPKDVFDRWIEYGSREVRPRKEYTKFAADVQAAQAMARLTAEWDAHDNDPRMWLRSGPGKETPDSPGWTTIVRPQLQDLKTINIFTSPDFIIFMATLRNALSPFPEALQALSNALNNTQPKLIEQAKPSVNYSKEGSTPPLEPPQN